MKIILINITLFLFAYCISNAQDTIVIDQNFKSLYFGTYCKHISYADSIHALPSNSEEWRSVMEEDYRLDTDKENWLSVYIRNETNYNLSYLLFLHNVQIDRAKLFVFEHDSLIYESPATGCTIPASKRPNMERTMALPIHLSANTVQKVFINVYRKEFGITVSPHLVNPVNGIDFRWTDYFFFMVIGCNVVLLAISLLMYYYAKQKQIKVVEIAWFIIYIIISTLYVVSAAGFGSLYLWTNYPWFEINSAIFFGAISGASFIYFCKLALGITKQSKAMFYWFDFVALFYFISSIPGFLLYGDHLSKGVYGSLIGIAYLCLLSCILFIVYKAIVNAWIKKQAVYYWFLGIFIFYIGYTILVLALEIGYIRYNYRVHAWRIVLFFFPQLVVTVFYLISKLLKTIEEKVQQISMLRKEISHDIHDEIGSSLTKVSLLSHSINTNQNLPIEIKKKVVKIGEDAVKTNSLLRDLIFAINPTSDYFDSLQIYIREIANIYSKDREINVHFNLKKSKHKTSVDPNIKSQLIASYKLLLEKLILDLQIKELTISFNLIATYKFEMVCEFEYGDDLDPYDTSISLIKKQLSRINSVMTLGINEGARKEIRIDGLLQLNTMI